MRWAFARVTTPDTLDAVIALDALCFERPWGRDAYARELTDPDRCWLISIRTAAGAHVGHCGFWRLFDEIHINTLAVHPEWRRQGAGRALLDEVLATGVRLDAPTALLEVRASNTAAVALYQSAGFRIAQVRRGYYINPAEDALVLWRTPASLP